LHFSFASPIGRALAKGLPEQLAKARRSVNPFRLGRFLDGTLWARG
jgi:hypothetical protein